MIALWNRADHYIFIVWFLLFSFCPRLISTVADWMSTILPHMVWRCEFKMQVWNLLHGARWKYRTQILDQKSPSGHHRTTLSGYISSQLRHVSSVGKKLVKQQYVLHMSPQYGELRPTSGWDPSGSLRHPCKFQRVSRLGSVTARHLVVGVSQTLRRWTESATYVRQATITLGIGPHSSL